MKCIVLFLLKGFVIVNIVNIKVKDLKPYKNNAKFHDEKQINGVANSISQFGFVQPLVVDKNNYVIIGHCRLLAAKKLNYSQVPCVMADDLTDEQVKALRLADNRLNESEWDLDLLNLELDELNFSNIDMSDFGFDDFDNEIQKENFELKQAEFEERMASGALSDDDEEYQEFVQKFQTKKTTDDCYTPTNIYNVVADYVSEHYGVSKDCFVRPFVPNGDYQSEKYKSTDIVVDNPPFSILVDIKRFYNERGIKYFLFCPNLTLFSSTVKTAKIVCGNQIVYDNGAAIPTSFCTNLEDCICRSAPDLYKKIDEANRENLKARHKALPKYQYPINVVTPIIIAAYSKNGIDFKLTDEECYFIRALDEQKECGKNLFGGGYLISERKKAEREKAEREKAEKEKAEVWQLSQREVEIIKSLK